MNRPTLFGEDAAPDVPHSAPSPPLTPAPDELSRAAAGQTRSLYRKYRPTTFATTELVGQDPIVRTLRNAIARDRVGHAYLFCGPRGTGKTSTARLLAKAVNCLAAAPADRPCGVCAHCVAITTGATTDVVEIDAASNRGIDDIRELRERVNYAPSQLKTKFYIIDEAHQITGAAANAFLKTLEEPPAHTRFVLATTDPEELLPTIVSRCQRFDFRRIALESMVDRLRTIADAEKLTISDDALFAVARASTGSLRDAEGLLDQLSVYQENETDEEGISVDHVRALLGISRNDRIESLVASLAAGDARQALSTVNEAVEAGEDPRQINRQLVAYLRVLLHERAGGSPDADETASNLAGQFELSELARHARRFSEIDYRIRHAPIAQLPLEVALIDAILNGTPAAPTTAARSLPEPDDSMRVQHDRPVEGASTGTSLRDRVRGDGPVRKREPARPAEPVRPAAVTTPPAAPVEPRTIAESDPTAMGTGSLTVESLADLWPRIRMEVKAVNRRIEALLTSIDPVAVDGTHVTLAAAYEFHRNRLNTDEVRQVVEDVVGRLVQRQVQITCVMRGDIATSSLPKESAAPLADAPQGAEPIQETVPNGTDPPDNANAEHGNPGTTEEEIPSLEEEERRIQAVKNILDAEEIRG